MRKKEAPPNLAALMELRPGPRALLRGALFALTAAALACAAGLWAPLGLPEPPAHESGLLAVLLAAALALASRAGISADEVWPLGAAARLLRRLDARALALFALGFTALVGAAAARRYDAFQARAYDLAIFDQAIWATTHGRFLFSSLKGDIALLGDHFSPALALFAPLYWVAPDPRALVAAQAAALALGAFPLFALARKSLGGGALAALFPLAWLAAAPVRNLALYDFHPESLAAPALLGAVWALHEKRWAALAALAALVASCKESSALALVGLGLYAGLALRAFRPAAALALAGAVVFAVDVGVLMPHFAGRATAYTGRYAALGSGLSQVLLAPLLRPWEVLERLVWPTVKLEGLLRQLLPYGFAGLGAPAALAASLPNWLVNAMADYPPMHNTSFQYHAETMAFIAAASAAGAGAIARRWPSRRRLLGLAMGLCALAQAGRPELSRLWRTPVTPRHAAMAKLLSELPPQAAVSADSASATHAAHRFGLFHFPEGLDRADVVAVDESVGDHRWHSSAEEREAALASLPSRGFALAAEVDGFRIWMRPPRDGR